MLHTSQPSSVPRQQQAHPCTCARTAHVRCAILGCFAPAAAHTDRLRHVQLRCSRGLKALSLLFLTINQHLPLPCAAMRPSEAAVAAAEHPSVRASSIHTLLCTAAHGSCLGLAATAQQLLQASQQILPLHTSMQVTPNIQASGQNSPNNNDSCMQRCLNKRYRNSRVQANRQ